MVAKAAERTFKIWNFGPMSRYSEHADFEDFEDWVSASKIRHRWLEHDSERKPRPTRDRDGNRSRVRPSKTRLRDSAE